MRSGWCCKESSRGESMPPWGVDDAMERIRWWLQKRKIMTPWGVDNVMGSGAVMRSQCPGGGVATAGRIWCRCEEWIAVQWWLLMLVVEVGTKKRGLCITAISSHGMKTGGRYVDIHRCIPTYLPTYLGPPAFGRWLSFSWRPHWPLTFSWYI